MNNHDFISQVLFKKELNGLPEDFAEKELNSILSKRKLNLSTLSPKEAKLLMKDVRNHLRKYVGRFTSSTKNRKDSIISGNLDAILLTHSSTKERVKIYPWLKQKISELSPKSILDLGCGINPIMLADKTIFYYACDINSKDLDSVNQYFALNHISGKVFLCDLKDPNISLPKSDLTLILKVLDIIEKSSPGVSERILSNLQSKNVIVSFSTRTLSGKIMHHPQREWFERLLNKHDWAYTLEKKDNELFYFIRLN